MQGVCPQPLLHSGCGSAAVLRASGAWYQPNLQQHAGALVTNSVQVGEGLPGAFPHQKSHSRGWEGAHAAGAALQWLLGCSGRTEVLIKGAVLLPCVPPTQHALKGALPTGCTLTRLERAITHTETCGTALSPCHHPTTS